MRLETEQPLITSDLRNSNSSANQIRSISISSNKGTYTFKRDTYSASLLEPVMSRSEYDEIISKASIIMGDSLVKKKQYDSFTIPLKTKVLCLISCVFLALYVIMFYAAESSQSNNVVYFIFSTLFISAGIFITMYQSYSSFFSKDRVYLTLNEIIHCDLKKYFEEINARMNGRVCFVFEPEERKIECRVYSAIKQERKESQA